MTTWGAFSNHAAIGLDIWTDGYDTYTPSINVYVQVSVWCQSGWNFNDAQQAVLSGSAGGTWNFTNNLGSNGTMVVGTATLGGQGQSYGGGPTYNFHAVLNGNYLGGTSVVDASFTLPARPGRAPSPPVSPPVYSSITATGFHADWGGSSDWGGYNPDISTLHVAVDAGASNLAQDLQGGGYSRDVTGLLPNTPYWCQSFLHNAYGWSGGSAITGMTTASFAPGTPTATPSSTDATVNWTAPTGGTPSNYQLQVATTNTFAAPISDTTAAWATSKAITGLAPATTYYARVRAQINGGWGAWSTVGSFQTLSGAKARSGAAWTDCPAFARSGGVWVPATVYKRNAGAWTT